MNGGWSLLELGKAGGGGRPPHPLPPAVAAQNSAREAQALRGKGDFYGREVLVVGSSHQQAVERWFGGGHG